MNISYDCFSTKLDRYANIKVSYERFEDIYSALIYAYKKSFIKFKPNIPNNNLIGHQYRSVVRKYIIKYYNEVFPYNDVIDTNIIVYHDKIKKAKFIQKFYRKRLKRRLDCTLIIQRRFREVILNPYYLLCKKRLMREFNEMNF